MKAMKLAGPALGVVVALTLGACATSSDSLYGNDTAPSPRSGTPDSVYPVMQQSADTRSSRTYAGYGVVHSVERVSQQSVVTESGSSGGIGLGTVAGAVVGGLAGSQVGSGSGTTAATVIGAAGGAYAGHEIERRQREPQVEARPDMLKVTVRMSDGSYQAVLQPLDADLRVGDRVRVGEGVVQRY